MPSDRLTDARLNLDWAEENIVKLDGAIKDFIASKPYTMRTDLDTQSNEIIKKAFFKDPDWRLSFMARDIVHAIRVPLDILASELAILNGWAKHVYFPVKANVKTFNNRKTQRTITEQFGPTVATWIASLQPYKGGDYLTWAINEIDRTDKHRKLSATGPRGSGIQPIAIKGSGPIKHIVLVGGSGTRVIRA
jgi:hypothetical protein